MSSEIREVRTDVLIVGSGGAALRAALEANTRGARVLAVVKGEFRKSGATFHSVAEVGAFNVPDGAGDPEDNPEVFLNDILKAAQGMSDPRLSRIVATEAADTLRYLEQYGVHFERAGDKYLVFRACFSSKPRSHVLHEHFKPILKALGSEATRRGIEVMDRLMIVNLIARNGECLGALAIDADGQPVVIRAKSTILTTGGASQLFAKNLYPSDITGDGYAMAHRAGARLVNLEFMQAGVSVLTPFINLFGNYLWDAQPNLTDREGKPFVEDYLPPGIRLDDVIRQKERHFPFSASDISCYIEISIQQAINDGRGTPEGGVYMDFIGRDFDAILKDPGRSIAKMWPLTYEWYKQRGVDLYRDKVQITCSAHAINGGLYIDSDAQSNLKGLFAAGEVAAGPHGADRLGGNMAMTCQVFGRRAGVAAAERALGMDHPAADCVGEEHRAFMARFRGDGTKTLAELRAELQRVANHHLLIIRDKAGLSHFRETCRAIRRRLLERARIVTPDDIVRAIELDNLLDVGELMATAALERRESRGGHYRRDFPESDPGFDYNLLLDRNQPDGVLRARLKDL
jgi:fumarate reductase (CoM/CoB) subunit A